MQFELKLADGRRVVGEGRDGEDAARRYVDAHRDAVVVAFRNYPRHGVFMFGRRSVVVEGEKS